MESSLEKYEYKYLYREKKVESPMAVEELYGPERAEGTSPKKGSNRSGARAVLARERSPYAESKTVATK